MTSYKLVYFNGRGLGEMCRLLFAEANQKYEDFRICSAAQWAEVKEQMPFKKVPVLFVDGAHIANSRAAFRFLAREFGLAGSCNIEQGKIDVWLETFSESFLEFPHTETDQVKKAEKIKEAMEKFVKPKLSLLNEEIKKTKGPYLFEKFSAADVAIYALIEIMSGKFGTTVEDFPAVDALQKTVALRPNIKAWLDTRPPEIH